MEDLQAVGIGYVGDRNSNEDMKGLTWELECLAARRGERTFVSCCFPSIFTVLISSFLSSSSFTPNFILLISLIWLSFPRFSSCFYSFSSFFLVYLKLLVTLLVLMQSLPFFPSFSLLFQLASSLLLPRCHFLFLLLFSCLLAESLSLFSFITPLPV